MSFDFEKIGKVIENTKLGKHLMYKITKHWENIFGNILAKVCIPTKIKDKTLFVIVKNHSWIQELIFSKSSIIKNMNKYNIIIKDIKFTCQEKDAITIDINMHSKNLSEAEHCFINDVSYPIKNKELKLSFQKMLKAYIENNEDL